MRGRGREGKGEREEELKGGEREREGKGEREEGELEGGEREVRGRRR